MKRILSFVAASLLLTSAAAFAQTTIFYPNEEEAVFTVTAPDEGWEFTPSEGDDKDGGYCKLTADGTVLYFRTVAASEDSVTKAVEETYAYVADEYPNVELPEAEESKIQGLDALSSHGSGKDKQGDVYHFGFTWIFIDDKHVAEIWFETPKGEDANQAAAVKILESFKIIKDEE